MNEHRIYDTKVDINTQNTVDFYNERAKRAAEMECPYTAVLLGDQNPDHAAKWDVFEKANIMPLLKISEENAVLDIGCGMGRWAESVIPLAGYYLGADFSSEMVNIAKKRCVFEAKEYDFISASFQGVVNLTGVELKRKFDRVIIGGVCMYINDSDLKMCIDGLNDLLDEHCIMYFTETVALEKRLTLDSCPSEALKTTYDVIYRTPTEYNEYYKTLTDKGFKIIKQDFLPHLNNEKGFSETDRWFTVFER